MIATNSNARRSDNSFPSSHTHDVSQTQNQTTWDISQVRIVNVYREKCDAFLGHDWPKGLKNHPLCGMSGYFGNPFVVGRDGSPEEILEKYKEWLYHGIEVVDGRDPGEYRRKVLKELPGHYRILLSIKRRI